MFLTLIALERFFTAVQALVACQVRWTRETPRAFFALVRYFARVNSRMPDEVAGMSKSFAADFVFIPFLSSMRPLLNV